MWIRKKSTKYDRYYYFNTLTNESIWKKPKTDFHIFHILIKHVNSTKPVNLSEENALSECIELLKKIRKDKEPFNTFKEIAFSRSECLSSKRYGDLGYIVGNELHKQFEKAAFNLKKGEFSEPVKTCSGYHIIYRE